MTMEDLRCNINSMLVAEDMLSLGGPKSRAWAMFCARVGLSPTSNICDDEDDEDDDDDDKV